MYSKIYIRVLKSYYFQFRKKIEFPEEAGGGKSIGCVSLTFGCLLYVLIIREIIIQNFMVFQSKELFGRKTHPRSTTKNLESECHRRKKRNKTKRIEFVLFSDSCFQTVVRTFIKISTLMNKKIILCFYNVFFLLI